MSTTTQTRTVRASFSFASIVSAAGFLLAGYVAIYALLFYPFQPLDRVWPGVVAFAMAFMLKATLNRPSGGLAVLMFVGLVILVALV